MILLGRRRYVYICFSILYFRADFVLQIQGKLDRELRGEERKAKVVLPGEEGAVEEEE